MAKSRIPQSFTIPTNRPSSPPVTPRSLRSRDASGASFSSASRNKRYGFVNPDLSPPENIQPHNFGYHFSYTPPNRNQSRPDSESSEGSDEESVLVEDDEQVGDHKVVEESETEAHSDAQLRRPSIVRPLDEQTDFTVEELSEDDVGYDDAEVLLPQEASSPSDSAASTASEEEDIVDALKNLKCGTQEEQEKAREFEEAQRRKYRRKKKRWSVGGYKKRNHAQSIGSQSSDNADVEPLDDLPRPGSSRRLRRRTQGPEDSERPRYSLLFDAPPRELEELAALDTPPPLPSESDSDLFYDDEDDEDDSDDDIELLLPAWLMELDSNPSRPSTAASVAIST